MLLKVSKYNCFVPQKIYTVFYFGMQSLSLLTTSNIVLFK